MLISSTQSLIFSFTIITLLNPQQNIKANTIFKIHSFIVLLFLLVYVLLYLFLNDPILNSLPDLKQNILNPLSILRVTFFAFYLYQILHYCVIFSKSLGKYNISIDNYFSETGKVKLKWVKVAFFSALIIGLMAIIFQTWPSIMSDNIFTTILVIFYTVFAINFINYKKIYHIIEPAFATTQHNGIEFEKTLKKTSWDLYKQKILLNKIYLKEGITLIEMAQSLNVGRTTLSNFINKEENQNFNNWINQLRISEAKNLMTTNPAFPISYIAMKTGYSEQSNFSREFKQVTGETPSAWRK
ncbi:MAG: AraC family transcriptional regulator [Bacteroidales bacterium]|nr:AraC family transcriptional regulator [Bacteroidales bacterium]